MTILEYSKLILLKVSFNETLFEKELLKAKNLITSNEVIEFRIWCVTEFGARYHDIIEKIIT
tara:strand:+ start:5991 stop:6176 length:186 start_codon:yes stop_codon:yes gene_type:complete